MRGVPHAQPYKPVRRRGFLKRRNGTGAEIGGWRERDDAAGEPERDSRSSGYGGHAAEYTAFPVVKPGCQRCWSIIGNEIPRGVLALVCAVIDGHFFCRRINCQHTPESIAFGACRE